MSRRERRAAAKSSKTALSTGLANTPAALYQAGLQHFRTGRHLDAQICCQQALALDPEHADTLHLMGLLSLHAKQYDHARAWITRAIRQDARPEYLASLGTTLQQQGQYEEALKVLDKAIQLKPDAAELWRQLGDILAQLERVDQALLTYQHVLQLNSRHWDAAYKAGLLLHRLGRSEEALVYFNLYDKMDPDHGTTLQMRALAMWIRGQFEDGLRDIERAHALDPTNAEICNHVGVFLRRLGREQEALPWFDKALEIRSNFVSALDNKIISLLRLQRFDEVFALYARMKALGLNSSQTEWNVGLCYLVTGDFEAGLPRHHARLKLSSAPYPEIPRPMWLGGEDIVGKTILVVADEGLGDTIQFVRYIPMLAERGARVLLSVQDPLHRLLSNLRGVSQCIPTSAMSTLPPFDFHCPISSLPLAFGTRLDTIPSAQSYLPLPPKSLVQAWEDRLGPHTKLRVGLVWSGNPNQSNDHIRSMPLQTLSRILGVDATFISLQKDPRPDDAAVLRGRSDIADLTSHLTDFTETAALVSCLDLVISVCTSVAHLAGALGRPTWILLPYSADYRWLLSRDDSPWYPSVRLFRQDEARDYAGPIEAMRNELVAMISAWNTLTP